MRELGEIRKDIDLVDREIVRLIEKRMSYSREVAEYKKANGMQILDSAREEQVLSSRAEMAESPEIRAGIREIFARIMSISRDLQAKEMENEQGR